ncbi:MAG: lamin tail domain-containing protein, partial [Sedimentisphaerales bacterium]|nr:lamin tail domain-containing protein [Sedimentisphaerales bacterium]
PWHVTGDIVVPSGRTLTIEPGTTLFFNAGTGITVTTGGRLVAEGTQYNRIRLTAVPGGANWDGVKFDHTLTDNRLAYLDHEFGDGQGESTEASYSRVTIDNITWSGTNTRVLNIDHPSVICRNSVFPSISGTEPLHGDGLTGSEYIIFDGCTFGTATGYNDIIDFTHAQRPGPVFQIYNCVFLGGGDDGVDLDSTDAHVEGNVFMNFHGGGGDGTSNAVSTGDEGWPSEIYAARNIFIENDHGALLKEDSHIHAHNNVFINSTVAAVVFGEPFRNPPREPGRGVEMAGNIFWNNAAIFELFFEDPLPEYGPTGDVIVDYSSLPSQWHYLGIGNIDADPLFIDEVGGDFRLKADSGAIGTGAWGLDMGAIVPAGAAISGEPPAVTYHTDATLTVGGPGIVSYKYSVNSPTGPWSAEKTVDVPIVLTGLANRQSYTVYAIGKNSAYVWQNEEAAAVSHTWTIDTSFCELVINEVLAHTHGNDPDIIELYYDGPQSIELNGMSLTDNPAEPNKFEFGPLTCSHTIANPGDYIILYGDLTTLQDHLGFALSADGETLYLYDRPKPDGTRDLLDYVQFGPQINDYSIGRVGWDRAWKLNQMTFGSANIAQPLGDPYTLKINEWFTNGQVLFEDDFIELYNPHPQPASLAGLYLTDDPIAEPNKRQIVPLSFIPPEGYAVFWPNDGNDPSELNFKLSSDGEMIGLFDAGLNMIDQVLYGPQTTDVSQGRSPDGSTNFEFFDLPTPGVANTSAPVITTTPVMLAAESATKRAAVPTSPDNIDETWKSDPDFDDSAWLEGIGSPGGVGFETNPGDVVNFVSLITLDVEAQMDNNNETCYIRIPFTVDGDDLADFTDMTLKIRYDDGFVAYINGTELVTARRNFAGTPEWNSGADTTHSDLAAILFEYIDVFDYLDALRAGDNVLAIHGLNYLVSSSDFLISAELEGAITTIDYGEFPYPDAPDQLAGLRITELMYHDPSGGNFDYIELKNISDEAIKLDGLRFVDGILFEFPAGQLNPNECIVVVGNLTSFRVRYGYSARVAGVYSGALSGGGEKIVLSLAWPLEAAIMRFEYSDTWYPSTNGGGQSLHINDATIHPYLWNEAESWHAAAPNPGIP